MIPGRGGQPGRLARLGRLSRHELGGAVRVAAVTTALMLVCYAGVVALLDFAVAEHLTGQVDRQLGSRLTFATTNPEASFASAGVQTNGARYGLGIYGEPIGLWYFDRRGLLVRSAPGDPVLPAGMRPPPPGAPLELNAQVAGSTYRLAWLPHRGGWLLAAESLSELGHVEAVLVTSEAIALPVLLLAFFLVALAIGLRAAGPIEAARRRQLEFTADASHELRTPLSVIEAEVSLARSKPRTRGEYEAVLDRVASESRRLRAIVEDLLLLARLDSTPGDPPHVTEDLGEVASRCGERFSAVAQARRQHLEVAGPPAAGPMSVIAPTEWLDKLVGTLADNACRYAPEGGTIRISALELPGDRLALRVEDDGPGIPEPERPHVARRFRRATPLAGGHGLGLAIAQSVAAATGGQLRIGTSSLGGALVEVSWERAHRRAGDRG
jgi:signal transduction histidine kinase